MTCPICERSSFKCGCTDEDKYKYAREENEELEDENRELRASATQLISVSDSLPTEGQYVLAHISGNCYGDDDPYMYWTVAKLVRGISLAEREAMPERRQRKKLYKRGDEHGNNLVPYRWDEIGPGTKFGQDVDYWMPLPKIENCES